MRLVLAVLAATLLAPAAHARDGLTLGMVLEPPTLDPTGGAASAIREVTYQNIFQGLTRVDRERRGPTWPRPDALDRRARTA